MRIDVTDLMYAVEGILEDKKTEKEVKEVEFIIKVYIDKIIESKLYRISCLNNRIEI